MTKIENYEREESGNYILKRQGYLAQFVQDPQVQTYSWEPYSETTLALHCHGCETSDAETRSS